MSSNTQVSADIGPRFAVSPALAALIADRCPLRCPEARRVDLARMAALPWRDLLRALRLPVRRRTLRLLAKLTPDQCHPVTVRRLAQVLRLPHPALRILPHLPRLSRDTVRLMFVPTECITPRLLLASAASPEDEEPVNRVVRAIRCLRKDGRWPYRALGLLQLQTVERRLWSTAAIRDTDATFPSPPFPGLPGCLVPIRDARDLLAEAEGQHHCGTIYFPEVMADLAYFYRVLRPERATLLLLRAGSTAPWIVGDLRLFANAAPTAETASFVSKWLATAMTTAPEEGPIYG